MFSNHVVLWNQMAPLPPEAIGYAVELGGVSLVVVGITCVAIMFATKCLRANLRGQQP